MKDGDRERERERNGERKKKIFGVKERGRKREIGVRRT